MLLEDRREWLQPGVYPKKESHQRRRGGDRGTWFGGEGGACSLGESERAARRKGREKKRETAKGK